MCGIVGYVGARNATEFLLVGLHRLEYRGYDSSGVAAITPSGEFAVVKTAGRIDRLEALLATRPIFAHVGIGHTRWATHGAPTDSNAHPHIGGNGTLALVHNGVIENFQAIKQRLQGEGYVFQSATDSEVIAHLIDSCLQRQTPVADMAGVGYQPLVAAVQTALAQLQGTYGLAILFREWPEVVIAARLGSPLVVGVGAGKHFVASDASPLAGYTDKIVYLADHELAVLTADSLRVVHRDQGQVHHSIHVLDFQAGDIAKGGFEHFMLKEIFEQPESIENVMRGRLDRDAASSKFGGFNHTPQQLRAEPHHHHRLRHQLAREPGRRISDRGACADSGGSRICQRVAIPQSAVGRRHAGVRRHAKRRDGRHAGGLARDEAEGLPDARHLQRGGQHDRPGERRRVLPPRRPGDRRGLDEGVHVAMHVAGDAGPLFRPAAASELFGGYGDHRAASELPDKVRQALECSDHVREIAQKYADCNNFLYLGRQINFPTALEGALKLKEISYIHAEGYPAAEMKHGPIALVDSNTPSVFLMPRGHVYDKVLSNLQEIKARGGPVIAVVCEGDTEAARLADDIIEIPAVEGVLQPVVTVIPLQLLAYHIAVARGCDIDKPRNLAKSVTVE